MKQHHSIFLLSAASLACTLILMLAACTPDALDELPSAGTDSDAHPLTISVSDGGMYATGQTRAQEHGYQTVFTEGDRIGLYVVNNGTLDVENLCLTLRSSKWTLPDGVSQLFYSTHKSYHAYYPYRDDGYMYDKVSPGNQDFFESAVDAWKVNTDQSTYAQYTASDLMTARGEYYGIKYTLSFEMKHRMSLFILQVPATKYNYTEMIDGQEISKSYYRYTKRGDNNAFWQENPYTARLLVNTKTDKQSMPTDYEYFVSETKKTYSFTYSDLNLQPGRYTVITVNGGAVTEKTRALMEGDFYMKDGGILPQEDVPNKMSGEESKNCLGVVFWVGEIERIHWTQTSYLYGDHLLMRDHPECVHGMVVAMHDAPKGVYATGKGATEDAFNWAKSFSEFTPGERDDWEKIEDSDATFGYRNSRLMALYGSRHSETTFPARDAIATYAAAHPAPAGSSGWFLPSRYELATLCFGAPTNFAESESPYFYKHLKMLKEINPQIVMAAGNKLTGEYWSSSELGTSAWQVDLDTPNYNAKPKNNTYKVRAVLAF
jgi:hypothetical protein